MSILALAAGGVVGVSTQVYVVPIKVPIGLLLLGTLAAGYALGGDKPGTFGRGIMWSAALVPAALVTYAGMSLAAGGRT